MHAQTQFWYMAVTLLLGEFLVYDEKKRHSTIGAVFGDCSTSGVFAFRECEVNELAFAKCELGELAF